MAHIFQMVKDGYGSIERRQPLNLRYRLVLWFSKVWMGFLGRIFLHAMERMENVGDMVNSGAELYNYCTRQQNVISSLKSTILMDF